MRVLSLNFGGEKCASSFYRIWQYKKPLQDHGIFIDAIAANDFTDWNKVGEYNAVIVQKKLFSLGRINWLRRRAKKLLYDVDDAVWHPQGRSHHFLTNWRTNLRLRKIVRAADRCCAANGVLAGHLLKWNPEVCVIPMALDGRMWQAKAETAASTVKIGWSGAPVNLKYLESLGVALLKVQQRNPQAEFVVFCGKPPQWPAGPRCTHVPFQRGLEAATVRDFDIGLLPLPSDDFAQGKSPIKGLQYMATGIPSVVSPVGATREMFPGEETALFARSEAEWVEALEKLVRNPGLRRALGRQARARFESTHTLAQTCKSFARLLQSL